MVSPLNSKLDVCALEVLCGSLARSSHLPHVEAVQWRLDFVADTEDLTNKNCLQYTVKLETQCGEPGQSNVTFVCSEAQLEELVYKLKEIIRHCEVVAS